MQMRPSPSSPKSAAKPSKKPAEMVVKDIRRATRRHFSAEDKIRIVLEGLRGVGCITTYASSGVRLAFRMSLRMCLTHS